MNFLFVMNPQNAFLSQDGSVYMGEKAEILKVRLKDYAGNFKGTKIFFREKHLRDDEFFSCDKTHLIVNTPDFDIEPSLKSIANYFFDKTRYNAFYGTGLGDYVIKNKIENVYMAGVETHTSILFTAEELRNLGCTVNVVEPCCMSRDDHMHYFAVSLMANFLGVRIANE